MEYLITGMLAALNALVIVAIWFTKRWMVSMEKAHEVMVARMDLFLKSQTECQLSLARTYQTKDDARAMSAKIDRHADSIVRLQTQVETLMDDGK